MNCLIYCILPGLKADLAPCAKGVDDQPVRLVELNDLGAAISLHPRVTTHPDVGQLRAYARVIASLHDRNTVIPLRYGCVADDAAQVVAILTERTEEYGRLLDELDDCVELGVRILPENAPQLVASSTAPDDGVPSATGVDYLRTRAKHYGQEKHLRDAYRQRVEHCCNAMQGWFVKCASEPATSLSPLVSVYFLVRRKAIESFQRAFNEYRVTESAKLLLTGPWPPYNFVTTDRRLTLPEDHK
ncbi:MAG: GvpL/GvpF family gas vesicle protein [Solidesulfovibrio sp.]